MKSEPLFEPHLVARALTLVEAGEWAPTFSGWLCLRIVAGAAYYMHPRRNYELPAGSVLIVSHACRGTIRSSQLAQTQLHFFRVDPGLLTGLATLAEQRAFQQAAFREQAPRFLPPEHPLAEKFGLLCGQPAGNTLATRLQLLQLFIQVVGTDLPAQAAEPHAPQDARERLKALLREMPAAELMTLDFTGLAHEVHCTPRHLSRIFHDVVGVPYREVQTEVRLTRAKELLASTQSKVLDVALESGYQSLSLFNLMFKKHTGITPGRWRAQLKTHAAPKTPRRVPARLQLVA